MCLLSGSCGWHKYFSYESYNAEQKGENRLEKAEDILFRFIVEYIRIGFMLNGIERKKFLFHGIKEKKLRVSVVCAHSHTLCIDNFKEYTINGTCKILMVQILNIPGCVSERCCRSVYGKIG